MVGFGLGYQRFAAIVDNGTVSRLDVEDGPAFGVSSAESVLAALGQPVVGDQPPQ